MVPAKLGTTEANRVFTDQVHAQADVAKACASLLEAGIDEPKLIGIAENLAQSVLVASKRTLNRINGVPLSNVAVAEGKKTLASLQDSLEKMANVRKKFWDDYERKLPHNYLRSALQVSGTLDRFANRLATEATEMDAPVAAMLLTASRSGAPKKCHGFKLMVAYPNETGGQVFERFTEANHRSETAAGALYEVNSGLRRTIDEVEAQAQIGEAVAKDPEGRPIEEIVSDLKARAREILSLPNDIPLEDFHQINAGATALLHPREIGRFARYAQSFYAERDFLPKHEFVGNMRTLLGSGYFPTGTDESWKAALDALPLD